MSIRKIAGVETEFRLDCNKYPGSEQYMPEFLELEYLLDFKFPEAVVTDALRSIPSVNGFVRFGYLNGMNEWVRKREQIIEELEKENPGSLSIVEEHLAARRLPELIRPDKQREFLQRLGFSGGYTISGFRIYTDGSHPEVSTPECSNPLDIVRRVKAGEKIIELGRQKAQQELGYELVLYNTISDGQGNAWGCHENYLVDENLFGSLVKHQENPAQELWKTFLVTRIIYTGSGKLGSEMHPWHDDAFLLSQRSEFITKNQGQSTTINRSLINTRDIAYVAQKFGKRLHVIAGDSNRCELALYLKIGMSMVVLMMLEDDWFKAGQSLILKNSLKALQIIDTDLSLKKTLMAGNSMLSAIDIQRWFLDQARQWYFKVCLNDYPQNQVSWVPGVLDKLDEVLRVLAETPLELLGKIDWITKLFLFQRSLEKLGKNWSDITWDSSVIICNRKSSARLYLRGLDMAYHRLDSKSIYENLKLKGLITTLTTDLEINEAAILPPCDTRAFDRSKMIEEFRKDIEGVNWFSIFFHNKESVKLESPWRTT